VRLWRRRETLVERLAREGGLDAPASEARRPPWDKVGIHGMSRPREWDEVVTAEWDVEGESAAFVALADSILIEEGPDDVEALADAVTLDPPFRGEARRVGAGLWSVAARGIEVVRLPGQFGDELELVSRDGSRELRIDGGRVFGSIPGLEREGDYVVRARRLEGDLFEVDAAPL
jgi:hypothetical protein